MRKATLAALFVLAFLAVFGTALCAGQPVPAATPSGQAATLQTAQPALLLTAAADTGCGSALAGIPAQARGSAAGHAEPSGPLCSVEEANKPLKSRPFHGFCRCSCTFTPDCNTSADCGGSPCLAGITCC
jgi:hypothetical protein